MKYLLSIFLFSMTLSVSGQNIANVFKYIEKEDVESIGNLLGEETDLCILENQEILLKAEVKAKLSAFLSSNSPTSCEEVHSGDSKKKTSNYCLGKLKTITGNQYRIFVFTEDSNIVEIRIDEW